MLDMDVKFAFESANAYGYVEVSLNNTYCRIMQ